MESSNLWTQLRELAFGASQSEEANELASSL